jgi:aspartate-semialdehyde dehydrogenase
MDKQNITIAIVGATGLVGRTFIKVLEEHKFPFKNIKLLASEKSVGKELLVNNKKYPVELLKEDSFEGVDIALFSAGKDVALKFAPIAAASNCIVIDNSSAWRMDKDVPLIVPEVNPESIKNHKNIIANPNCSTIQLVVALKPIDDKFKLSRIVVSTYQSITGAGQTGVDQLMSELKGVEPKKTISSHRIAFNTVFHKIYSEDGFSVEEIKMIEEIRKIMSLPELKIAVTCVRIPVLGGHGESVNIETQKPFDMDELKTALREQEGLIIIDNPLMEDYPTVELSSGTDPVYVGRLRRDASVENGAYLWVCADNLRKGAATNAVQIAELILRNEN